MMMEFDGMLRLVDDYLKFCMFYVFVCFHNWTTGSAERFNFVGKLFSILERILQSTEFIVNVTFLLSFYYVVR